MQMVKIFFFKECQSCRKGRTRNLIEGTIGRGTYRLQALGGIRFLELFPFSDVSICGHLKTYLKLYRTPLVFTSGFQVAYCPMVERTVGGTLKIMEVKGR